jgi:hypothetical protein
MRPNNAPVRAVNIARPNPFYNLHCEGRGCTVRCETRDGRGHGTVPHSDMIRPTGLMFPPAQMFPPFGNLESCRWICLHCLGSRVRNTFGRRVYLVALNRSEQYECAACQLYQGSIRGRQPRIGNRSDHGLFVGN